MVDWVSVSSEAANDVTPWCAAETDTDDDVTVFGVLSTDDVCPCDVMCEATAVADRSKNKTALNDCSRMC